VSAIFPPVDRVQRDVQLPRELPLSEATSPPEVTENFWKRWTFGQHYQGRIVHNFVCQRFQKPVWYRPFQCDRLLSWSSCMGDDRNLLNYLESGIYDPYPLCHQVASFSNRQRGSV